MKYLLRSICLVAGSLVSVYGQSVSGTPNVVSPAASAPESSHTVPISVLYRHFLAHVVQLDAEADRLQHQGKDGSAYRSHYQKSLGFSDEQFAKVRQVAVDSKDNINKLDAQAHGIIVAFRQQLAKQVPGNPSTIPPLPPELAQLNAQRDLLLRSELSRLQQSLGPRDSRTLTRLVTSQFGPHIKVEQLPLPTAPTPNLQASRLEGVPRVH